MMSRFVERAEYVRRISAAANTYLPASISRPLAKLCDEFAEDCEDGGTYRRITDIVDRSVVRYCDFARAIGRQKHTMTSAELERMLPGAHWATYRARLTTTR